MKQSFFITITCILLSSCHSGKHTQSAISETQQGVPGSSLRIRDPFVLFDKKTDLYYMYANNNPGIKVYKSKDLSSWIDGGNCFTATSDFWGKADFWAPDVYRYKGKYYLFVTFSDSNKKRGTSILVSNYPDKDFKPLVNERITPKDWMSLDGSLYIDDAGTPWMLFAREWVEVQDGQVVAVKLSKDLTHTEGESIELFKASNAPWVGPLSTPTKKDFVTDAPFIFKAPDGKLLMLWSSFTKQGKYAVGYAVSTSGTVLGPWQQSEQPLNDDSGGHAMLFRTKTEELMISYHAPNSNPERPILRKVKYSDGKLSL